MCTVGTKELSRITFATGTARATSSTEASTSVTGETTDRTASGSIRTQISTSTGGNGWAACGVGRVCGAPLMVAMCTMVCGRRIIPTDTAQGDMRTARCGLLHYSDGLFWLNLSAVFMCVVVRYEGEWVRGSREGSGTLIHADKSRLSGRWVADVPESTEFS